MGIKIHDIGNNSMWTTIGDVRELRILGEEFEKHGGLRPVIMATGMDDEHPIDDDGHYIELCFRLGEKETLAEGVANANLEVLIRACLLLRKWYGHGVWIQGALLDYLRFVKGESYRDAVLTRDSLYDRAIRRAGEAMIREMLETC